MSRSAVAPTYFFKARAFASALAALTVGGLLALGMTVPAQAAAAPVLNLTVKAADGSLDGGASVELYVFSTDDGAWEESDDSPVTTDGNGVATFTGDVPTGGKYSYFVSGYTGSSAGASGYEIGRTAKTSPDFSEDAPTATYATAVAGTNANTVTLSAGITATGNLLQPDGSGDTEPYANAFDVTAFRQTTTPDEFDASWVEVGDVSLDQGTDTSYSVPGLAPGTYVFEGSQDTDSSIAPYAFNDGASNADLATPKTVGTTDPRQAITFEAASTINGEIDLNGTPPAAGDDPQVSVEAFPVDADGDDISAPGFPTYTGEADPSTNEYSLQVAPGRYKIEFTPENEAAAATPAYFSGWYNNVADEDSAPIVNVSGTTTLATNTLGTGFGISGTITLDSGASESSLVVTATDGDGDTFTAPIDNSGNYSFTGLTPGGYSIDVSDTSNTYPDTFFTGSATPLGTTDESSEKIITGTSSDVTGVNFEFKPLDELTVSVANRAGTALTNVDVEAVPVKDGQYDLTAAQPNAAVPVAGHPGTYRITQLEQGQSYAIYFNPAGSSLTGTYPQFLGGSDTPGSSDLFTPMQSQNSISATLVANSSLSGVVASPAGKSLSGVHAILWEWDGATWVDDAADALTGSNGAYSFGNVPTGSYAVELQTYLGASQSYLGTFVGGTTAANATHYYIAPGHPAVASAHLVLGGTLSGTIAGGADASGIYAFLLPLTPVVGGGYALAPDSNPTGGFTVSGSTGKFSFTGVATGYYTISYFDFENALFGNPFGDLSSAPVYHVTAGVSTTIPGIITLPVSTPGVDVSGTLSGLQLGSANGEIEFTGSDGLADAASVINADGSFDTNLAPGHYTWTATLTDDDDPATLLNEPTGSIDVTVGHPVVISIDDELETPLAFAGTATADGGDTSVGTTFTVSGAASNRAGITPTYQWFRGAPTGVHHAIFGATDGTYTAQGGDAGQELYVAITIADPTYGQYGESVTQYAVATDAVTESDQLSATGSPSIIVPTTGAAVGVALHADAGDWNGIQGISFTYAWTSTTTDNVTTTVQTGSSSTYTPTIATAGTTIALAVTATKTGYSTPAPANSGTVSIPLLATLKNTVKPTVSAKIVAGKTVYTVTPGTWSVAGTTPVYTWFDNSAPVAPPAGSQASFTPSGSTEFVGVSVTATKAGYVTPDAIDVVARKSTASPILGDGQDAPVVTDSVSGDVTASTQQVQVGEVLTDSSTTFAYSDGTPALTVTYQWYRQGTTSTKAPALIAGANKQSYTVTSTDVGQLLTVIATASSTTHSPEPYLPTTGGTGTISSALSTPADVAAAPTNVDAPLTPVTETVSAWATTGVLNAYQWWICKPSSANDCTTFSALGGTAAVGYTPIVKATLSSYTPSVAQNGDVIVLRVTGTKLGYTAGIALGDSITVEYNDDLVGGGSTVPTTGGAALAPIIGTPAATWSGITGVKDTYKWYLCPVTGSCSTFAPAHYTVISGAISASFTPSAAQVGNWLVLDVTGTKTGYTTADESSEPIQVTAPTITVLTPPTFTAGTAAGKATFGVKVTAKAPTFSVAGVTATYAWETFDGSQWNHITGATGLTYTPVGTDFETSGQLLRLEVTATKAGYNVPSVTDSVSLALQPATPVASVKPSVVTTTGAYTVKPGSWPDMTSGDTVVWFVDGTQTATTDANQSIWDRTPSDTGHEISVTVTHNATSAPNTYNASAPTTFIVQKGAAPATDILSAGITGDAFFAGTPLGVSTTVSDNFAYPTGSTPAAVQTYQWYYATTPTAKPVAITTARSASFAPTTAYIGKYLSVIIASTSPVYATATRAYSLSTPFAAAAAQHGTATLTGNVRPGGTVGVALSGYTVSALTYGYQWQQSTDSGTTWTSITGAIKPTYVVLPTQLGDQLRIIITTAKSGYTSTTLATGDASNSQTVVQATTLSPIVLPSLTDATSSGFAAGTVVTANPGTWNVAGTTFTYQWLRNTKEIPGQTAATYTLTGLNYQDDIQVVVTAHLAGYNAVASTTNTIVPTLGAAPTASTVAKVTGTATNGATLTATTGIWTLDGLTFSYQWYDYTPAVAGGAPASTTAIPAATSSTYTVTSQSDGGSKIFVVVTATRAGYTQGTSTSAQSALVPVVAMM